MKKSGSQKIASASRRSASILIDARIQELSDWRGEMLSRFRALTEDASEAAQARRAKGSPKDPGVDPALARCG
jgi:hypothetical protein